KASLQAGVDAAFAHPARCDVWVAQGTYVPTHKADPSSDDREATLQMREGVAVYGGFSGTEAVLPERNWSAHPTIISGEIGQQTATDNLYHVVTSADGASLDGVTVTRGHGTRTGDNGAALLCEAGSFAASNVTFSDNTAYHGGAVGVLSECSLLVSDSTFSNNRAVGAVGARGGAISTLMGSLVVQRCDFVGNQSQGHGGAIHAFYGSAHLHDAIFEDNRAAGGLGGAVYANEELIVRGSTFEANRVEGGAEGTVGGGAIYSMSSLVVGDSEFR